MTDKQIDAFLRKHNFDQRPIKVNFRSRPSFTGIFVKTNDYDELRGKNFWRVINESNVKEYLSSKDTNLARIFNGAEFMKLSVAN